MTPDEILARLDAVAKWFGECALTVTVSQAAALIRAQQKRIDEREMSDTEAAEREE